MSIHEIWFDPMVLTLSTGILALVVVFLLLKLRPRLVVSIDVLSDSKSRQGGRASILALLSITVMSLTGAGCSPTDASRHKTMSFHRAIVQVLEHYHRYTGEYPSPTTQSVHAMLDGRDYDMSGALMLYQVLSGDGNDRILAPTGGHSASDGRITADEVKNVWAKEMPHEMIRHTEVGWMIVDGYGHPFQFTKGGPDSINATYDLWSFGEAGPVGNVDKAAKQAAAADGKWIRNW